MMEEPKLEGPNLNPTVGLMKLALDWLSNTLKFMFTWMSANPLMSMFLVFVMFHVIRSCG
jgi:hypothetical protein